MTIRVEIALLALLAPACAAESVEQPPAPPVNWSSLEPGMPAPTRVTRQERAAAELYLKALASPGFAQLGPALDEAVHFTGGEVDTHGRERVIAAHETLLGAYQQRQFVMGRAWLTNDEKALEWTMTGVGEGKPITIHGLTLLSTGKNDDSSIKDIRVYLAGTADPAADVRRVFESSGASAEITNVELMRRLVHGPDYFKPAGRPLAQLDTVIENAWGVQDFVVIEYEVSGRRQDRIERMGVVDVAEIRDGKITHIWRYGR